jgi:hypothetical protein
MISFAFTQCKLYAKGQAVDFLFEAFKRRQK